MLYRDSFYWFLRGLGFVFPIFTRTRTGQPKYCHTGWVGSDPENFVPVQTSRKNEIQPRMIPKKRSLAWLRTALTRRVKSGPSTARKRKDQVLPARVSWMRINPGWGQGLARSSRHARAGLWCNCLLPWYTVRCELQTQVHSIIFLHNISFSTSRCFSNSIFQVSEQNSCNLSSSLKFCFVARKASFVFLRSLIMFYLLHK